MDILGEYEKQHPQTVVQQSAYRNAAPSEGFLIRMLIKLSGGKVKTRQQALMVLLVIGGIGLLVATFLIFQSTGVTQHPLINAPPPEAAGKGSTTQ